MSADHGRRRCNGRERLRLHTIQTYDEQVDAAESQIEVGLSR
jgi:hypothetical protein